MVTLRTVMVILSKLVQSLFPIAKTNALQGNVRTKDIWSGKAQRSSKRNLFVSTLAGWRSRAHVNRPVARLIQQRLMIARGANGPVCYGTRRNTRIWIAAAGFHQAQGRHQQMRVPVCSSPWGELVRIGLHSPIAVTIVSVWRRKRALFSAELADDCLVKDRGGSLSRDRGKEVA